MVSRETPVAVLVTFTVALAMAAPLGSEMFHTTKPLLVWPKADGTSASNIRTAQAVTYFGFAIS